MKLKAMQRINKSILCRIAPAGTSDWSIILVLLNVPFRTVGGSWVPCHCGEMGGGWCPLPQLILLDLLFDSDTLPLRSLPPKTKLKQCLR